jgi:hypothetical protein
MKKSLLFLAISLCVTSAWAQDSNVTLQQKIQAQPPSKVVIQHPAEGALQRGIRMGNALQMISPFAPVEYGDGSEFVYYDENDSFQHAAPGKPVPKGFKLFGFSF